MTRFWREGHWRWRDGQRHWVDGHFVERDDWDRFSYGSGVDRQWRAFKSGRSWPRRFLDVGEPNATCPVCGEDVWFFRNVNGGSAYFDALGKPWPKHPCMDSRMINDRTADWQAQVEYAEAYDEEEDPSVLDTKAAYTGWALALLDVHMLEADIRRAEGLVKRAIAATQRPTDSTDTKRRRRERLRRAREQLRELKLELRSARTRQREAQVLYEFELERSSLSRD